MRRPIALTLSLVALVGVLAGCGGSSSSTTTSAQQSYCAAVAKMKSDMSAVTSINPSSSSVDQLKTSAQTLVTDMKSVVAAANAVHDSNAPELQGAVDALDKTVQSLQSGSSLSSVLAQIGPEITAVVTTAQMNMSNYKCQ